jgi:hypothetical protein
MIEPSARSSLFHELARVSLLIIDIASQIGITCAKVMKQGTCYIFGHGEGKREFENQ